MNNFIILLKWMSYTFRKNGVNAKEIEIITKGLLDDKCKLKM